MLCTRKPTSCVWRKLLVKYQYIYRPLDPSIWHTRRWNSTESNRENGQPKLKGEKGESTDELWCRQRQASIVTKYGAARTKKEDVLRNLRKNFRMTESYWEIFSRKPPFSRESDQALVILATPGYAEWLEDDVTFIPGLLQSMTRPFINPSEGLYTKELPFEIDLVCACVDALAPSTKWEHLQKGPYLEEGFSFLHGHSTEIIPDLWQAETAIINHSPGMQSSLIFTAERSPESQITLPLANTLFRNGRNSTLLVSRWKAQTDGSFQKVRSGEKSNQLIKISHNAKPGITSTSIPAIPLTPARRIISGLGNIVRQIQFDEAIGPASRELEANIDEYLDHTRRSKSTLAVWALVVPEESLPTQLPGPPNDLLFDARHMKKLWSTPDDSNTLIGHWIDRGATFCRVLSGGGGWGAKQGLLSLDPQTSYRSVNEARFDFSIVSLEEDKASALGNIACPNAYIQFFVANTEIALSRPVGASSQGEDEKFSHSKMGTLATVFQSSTVFGSIPSTVDDIPRPDYPLPENAEDTTMVQIGHFGALSESGIYYNSTVAKDIKAGRHFTFHQPISTKIDLPYSFFYRDYDQEDISESSWSVETD